MGVIYKAYDTLMRRDVALKTILDVQSKSALDLFYREWGLQASITHPNVAEIYDIGQMELEGGMKPYFVMPLLPGETLTDLMRTAPHRLTTEKVVDMISQVCRGLQAAHDKGLIHRDLKPSNIFVMTDDSVKIIDFGIAHAESSAQTSVRGTLAYMAPELLQMKPASVATDIFALGVLTYETMTRRRPFEGSNDSELSRAILYHNPPPASELSTGVSQSIARVVQKAIAKQPWNRYSSAKEFGDTLNKALRGEPIDFFDPEKVRPRIERAQRAFERAEYPVATEMLNELESEGHIDQEISMLRRQVEQAQRQVAMKQYLESARRFFEEEEYQLALRKIQEALELDPNNTDAQALKNEVEKKRRVKKIEEWAQLARKHLDNNAFSHARSAINSLLELKPNDTDALSLMAEVKRREEDFERLRGEKSKLISVAKEAWQRGEVTAALSNLERYMALDKTSPDTDGERLMAFQNFYKTVRGEHEALKNSYDRARKLLADGNFAESLQICQQYLSKYPGHALFQALKYDVEERQRQNISAFIAETDRRVENEPDLDRRVAILEEALKQNPGEPHFERALKLTRDKRDLVSGVVSKARLHEDQGRHAEALDQWEVLRAIHGTYPGLDYEIDRVRKRRDSQSRTDAKAHWVAQIDRQLEARDYQRALDSVRQGMIEFPDDPELAELQKMVQHREALQAAALKMMEQGRDAISQGRHDEGLGLMRKAYAMDEGSPVLKPLLVEALADRARPLMDENPDAAESLVREALELDPQSAPALNLRALRGDKKKEEFIGWCTAQARKLQAANDIEGAIAVIQQGLASHPNDARLNQLLSTLDRTNQEQSKRLTRKRDVELIRKFEEQIKSAQDAKHGQQIAAEAAKLAEQYKGDDEFQLVLANIRQNLAALSAALRTSAVMPAPAAAAAAPKTPPQPVVPPPAPPSPPKPPAAAPPPAAPKPPAPGDSSLTPVAKVAKNRRVVVGTIAAAVVILAGGIIAVLRHQRAPVQAAAVKVEIKTTPPGAAIRVSGLDRGVSNLSLDLQPGEYKIEATLEGYQPALSTFTVREGAPSSVDIPLEPFKPFLRLYSDIENGQAALGDKPMNPGQPGEFVVDPVEPGSYKLKFTSAQGEASAGLAVELGATPAVNEPLQVKNIRLVLVNVRGDRAVVYVSSQGAKAGLDGQPSQPVPVEGLGLSGLTPGTHQLTIEDGPSPRTLALNVTGAPGTFAFIMPKTDSEGGIIVVTANEDNASITVNGYAHPYKTRNGLARLAITKPGKYTIKIAREGYEVSPPQVEVEVVKGQEVKAAFTLKAVVKMAKLALTGVTAGAQVVLDGNVVGTVNPDGTYLTDVPPGPHTLELHRGALKSKPVSRTFSAGENVQLGAELALIQPPGTLRLDLTPSDAKVTVRLATESEAQARPFSPNPMSLPEGTYVVVIAAPQFVSETKSVTVASGATSAIAVNLRSVGDAKKAASPAGGGNAISEFDDPIAWTPDGPWMVRKGGGYVTYSKTPTGGTFVFTVTIPKGKTLMLRDKSFQWFLGFTDPRNFMLFRVDKKNFQRIDKVNGRDTDGPKKAHTLDKGGTFSIRIEVEPHRIVHSLGDAGRWIPVDEVQDANRDFTKGKFGFYIPGNDEYGVKDFTFQSRR